jgi:hypothetical protein
VCIFIYSSFSVAVGEISAISWDGTEVLWEEFLDVVLGVVSVVESPWLVGMVVWGVGITSVGVAVVVDNAISWVVLKLGLLIIISVTVGELIRVLERLEKQVHVVHVDWVVAQLNESNLSSSVSGSAEAEVLNNLVLWISSVQDLLIVGLVTVAKVVRWLVVVLGFDVELVHSLGGHEDVSLVGEDSSNRWLLQANSGGKTNKSSNSEFIK